MLRIETIDAPTWWAVLLADDEGGALRLRCVGFRTARARDNWLSWFTVTVGTFFDSLPLRF